MKTDDLNTPLKARDRTQKRSIRLFIAPITGIAAIGVAIFASVWVAAVDDPHGGQPVAYAQIDGVDQLATGSVEEAEEPSPFSKPADKPIELASKPRPPDKVRNTSKPLDHLIEKTSLGLLPKIGDNGMRPLDAYARPAKAGPFGGRPRIVIIVGGMGVSQTSTQRAIAKLPPDVTLAFAPYGGSLDRWVTRARREGHEVLLQVPMEPFGYPQTKPGPHTLLTSAKAKQNADSLKWALTRMTSYTGVMNYMGGRYLANGDALRPFLNELSNRGLMFVDDGAAEASKAMAVGQEINAHVVAGDLIIDRVRSRRQIVQSLELLEKKARADGIAIGVASAFRISIDEIAAWSVEAEKRGFAIVPASAALAKRK